MTREMSAKMESSNSLNQLKITTAVKHFENVVNEFVNTGSEPVTNNNERDIFVSKNFKRRCKRINMTINELLMHIFNNNGISVVFKHWLRTRANYVDKENNTHLNMKNFFAWREVGTVYLYVIDLKEAFVDIVPKDIDQDFVIWAKECQRFIECSNYPEITHWFNHKACSEYNTKTGIDNQYLLEKLQNCFGDKCGDKNNTMGNITYNKEDLGLCQTINLSCSTNK